MEKDLLEKTTLCVISSICVDGKPQSAVVSFSQTDEGKIIIGTSKNSRKYKNIQTNPHVSLVVGWDELKTVQLEGLAHLANEDEIAGLQKIHFAKLPFMQKSVNDPMFGYIVVSPSWQRVTDISQFPWVIEEKDLS